MSCKLCFYFVSLKSLRKFIWEELANMPTSNLSKMVHNIWFQKSKKKGACLYAMAFDDYM